MTLLEAYEATTYRVSLPSGGTADVRIGQRSPALDAALAAVGAGSWGFVTAANPAPRRLSRPLNARRHLALLRRAGRGAWGAVGLGHSGWPDERGVAVVGASKPEVLALGRAFGQLAVVYGEAGAASRLAVVPSHPED